MQDTTILEHINALVEEEKRLRAESTADPERIRHIEEQLDQCWDLLRQRRAKREFGDNPDEAQPRDIETVEKYIQ
ncbi:MAG TPA: DUF2630 family protein [Albitalea sp.]